MQGTGQRSAGLVTDYADGFVTDPELLSHGTSTPSDPSPFFAALMTRPYLSQIVVAPHLATSALTRTEAASASRLHQRLSGCAGSALVMLARM